MKRLLSSLYLSLAKSSPRFEVLMRKIYWSNVGRLQKFSPNKATKTNELSSLPHVDFEKVLNWLRSKGVGEGSLLIVHSSYTGLECTGLSAEDIVQKLVDLVGTTGTLCMPVIRTYKGEKKGAEYLTDNLDDFVANYNVLFTKVNTGLLPYALMRRPDAVISHHPLNPMAAVGPLANEIMEHNLEGDKPAPHGPNSSWKYCYDHGALIASIGVELDHHNTIMHIAEEAFGDWRWTDEEWYRIRKFNVIDENKNTTYVEVKERKPIWGTKHFAETYYINDMKKHGIIEEDKIDGIIPVCFERSSALIERLRSMNKNGYPYFK